MCAEKNLIVILKIDCVYTLLLRVVKEMNLDCVFTAVPHHPPDGVCWQRARVSTSADHQEHSDLCLFIGVTGQQGQISRSGSQVLVVIVLKKIVIKYGK